MSHDVTALLPSVTSYVFRDPISLLRALLLHHYYLLLRNHDEPLLCNVVMVITTYCNHYYSLYHIADLRSCSLNLQMLLLGKSSIML